MSAVNRREFLAGVAGAVAITGVELASPPVAAAQPDRAGTPLAIRQGTNVAGQLSPDGATIAMDLLGVLWLLPAGGGAAKRITDDLMDIAQPDWSPDGKRLAFQSYRDGNFNIWTVNRDGTGLRQLTEGPFDHREPRFSPDGGKIVFSSDLTGSYGIHLLDLATNKITQLTDTPVEEYEPAWSPDGAKVAFVAAGTRIDVVTVADGSRSTAITVAATQQLHSPAWTPDGKDLVYNLVTAAAPPNAPASSELYLSGKPLVTGEEAFPFRVSWRGNEFLYSSDGALRRRSLAGGPATEVAFTAPVDVRPAEYTKRRRDFDSPRPKPVVGIGSPVLSPDGAKVAFRALNDIYTMTVGEPPKPLTRDEWWKSDPAWSPDGRYLSYSTDRAGKLDIWLRDLTTGQDRQLTNLPGAAAVSGSWSRDGKFLAFLDQTGALFTVEVATGAVQKVFTATFEPGRPTWSPDGTVIALAAIVPYSTRYREGLSKILLVNRVTGAAQYVDPLPHRSLQTRGDDGPVWSPDGKKMAFVVGSLLHVVDVHPDGTFAGTPKPVNDEVTDAPTWHGDSKHLLYLNNGRLRMIGLDGGAPRTIPVGLSWTNTQPRGRLVIRAGKLWDGQSPTLQSDVDVVVEGHRIRSVHPSGPGVDGQLIDARDGVVMPGIVDIHNHREMQGYSYGARQGRLWLSLGITTTRSPGSPAYHMVEERESIQSGRRVGPRYFATGEAIDGSRIFYNFMRPTYDTRQLALELERAGALDYDLMKCYVRLRPEWQKQVIGWAHGRGLLSTSHYHYPALAFGGDGMEHIGATNRLGYSRTITALGAGYQDVIDLFNRTGAGRTPTLFLSGALLGEDPSLVTDRRVKTLYPTWEYASLVASAQSAATTDQTANLNDLAKQVAQIAATIRGGGRIVTGTDSPIDHTAVSTHMNLRAMVKYGLTPYEALVTATRNAGDLLGEPLGRIAPGMYADLSVLGGDPLTDIKQAANVRSVVSNGRLFTVDDLLKPFAASSTGVTANRIVAPVPDHPSNAAFWWHDEHYVAHSRHACCTG
ncbi:amidohydrolase family protein [Kutzneria kofuensis]|uniref:Tol biopolymer transport system component n=2 Tax=Kutzneria kofuensis TaxID=103725 RepID=A0A7W9KS81_9PSEU|nr:amidohydrolase family protein [Kutzneria kofuensis]MBB5897752.1 Tol biopolymer transport system component [Kutzneria kofuensis]